VDAEDKLWIAHWGGGCVTRWDTSTGKMLAHVAVPANLVTSVVFGGDNLDTLYITTARNSLNTEKFVGQPYAGCLFACVPGVTGLPTNVFQWVD
ncbi:MAG: SMP-30/gluconolactonase/LRE family protein, partial [Planctomycetaceae bacterium]|nr:SMP-30/gluconolactonase/LRE family protein [Planctomycetaceae bacterium]